MSPLWNGDEVFRPRGFAPGAHDVRRGSLRRHPGSPQTNTHLGRIFPFRKDYPKAKTAYLEALAADPFDPEIHIALIACGCSGQDMGVSGLDEDSAARLLGELPGLELDLGSPDLD